MAAAAATAKRTAERYWRQRLPVVKATQEVSQELEWLKLRVQCQRLQLQLPRRRLGMTKQLPLPRVKKQRLEMSKQQLLSTTSFPRCCLQQQATPSLAVWKHR